MASSTNAFPRKDHPTKKFFTFANTIAGSTFERPHSGHGWIGVRFPNLSPDEPTNDVVIHVRLHDPDISLQQESIEGDGREPAPRLPDQPRRPG